MRPGEDFAEFAEAVSPRLRRMAFLLCGDWHSADDLVQSALTKVFVSWRRIRRHDMAYAYAARMLVNTYLATPHNQDRRETNQRRHRTSSDRHRPLSETKGRAITSSCALSTRRPIRFCRADDDTAIICDQNRVAICRRLAQAARFQGTGYSACRAEELPLTGHVLDYGIQLLRNLPWEPRRALRHSGPTEQAASSAEPRRTSATPMPPRPIATRELGELSDDE